METNQSSHLVFMGLIKFPMAGFVITWFPAITGVPIGVIGDIPPKPTDRAGLYADDAGGPTGVVAMGTGTLLGAVVGYLLAGMGVELAMGFLRSAGGGASGIVFVDKPERRGLVLLP